MVFLQYHKPLKVIGKEMQKDFGSQMVLVWHLVIACQIQVADLVLAIKLRPKKNDRDFS